MEMIDMHVSKGCHAYVILKLIWAFYLDSKR